MSKKLLIETWLEPDPDDRITTHDLYCAAMEATERIEELEAENKKLRLDAHTKEAFYGVRIEELEAEVALQQREANYCWIECAYMCRKYKGQVEELEAENAKLREELLTLRDKR